MGSATEEVREHLLVDVDGAGGLDSSAKLRVRDLTRQSETTGETILTKVNLDVPEGVIMGIIGPSGSGKSTLLRALNRLWEPPSGSVLLDGEDICELDVLSLRRRVGMLFQMPALFDGDSRLRKSGNGRYLSLSSCDAYVGMATVLNFSGTVADNVRYGPQLKGKKLTEEEVRKLLSLADLDPSLASKAASELSVGQAQRVALARTLANNPEVLLLDEPTSALDPISTQNIEEAIVRLKKTQRMTTVMVSHSVKQIQRIADLVCLLVAGEVVEVLQPSRLSEAQHPMARRFLELS